MCALDKDDFAEEIVQSLAKVAREIEKLEDAREVRLKSTHGRFNLFTTLLDAHDEVRLHTRYLAHLLDPKGMHDCKRMFLDAFLDVVELPDLKNQKCKCIAKEHYTGGLGYIDIYMEFDYSTVVIENKIDAKDQGEQLERYDQYAKRRALPVHLFYLTRKGDIPSPASLGSLSEKEIRIISYEKDILLWLEQCLRQTYEFVNINQALQQYKMTINQLLGNTLEVNDMNEIKSILKNNKMVMQHSDQIKQALQEIKSDREKEIQDLCLEILGKNIERWIWYWEEEVTAFKFTSPAWGSKETTDITVMFKKDETFSLRIYDSECGILKKIIDSDNYTGTWTAEDRAHSCFWRTIQSNLNEAAMCQSLKELMNKLEKGLIP